MNSLTDYIEWYAALTFDELPFNEVDNLILSTLIYYRFDLKKTGGSPAALRRCVIGSADDPFLRAALRSRRFGSLPVSDFEEVFDKDTGTQFAAVCFHLTRDKIYVAFRGTDNSLVGWREDFMISYMNTAAQCQSVKYLSDVIRDSCTYFVGGHSKGGNLAMYAACHLSDAKLACVEHVYNNDGPGLCPDVSDVRLIERIRSRTTVILPQYCIFGKIFAHDIPDTKIVLSSCSGIAQHDIVSWSVRNGALALAADFDPENLWINGLAEKWIKDVTPSEREKLVNSIFDTFEAQGATTYGEAMKGGLDGVENLLKNMVESDTVKTAAKLPEKALFGDLPQRLRSGKLAKFIDANELIEGVALFAVALLMLIIPKHALQIIVVVLLGGVVGFQLYYTVKKLYESQWNFERERTRVYIFVAIATLYVIMLIKKQAIFVVGSGLAGGWLLVVAYKSFLSVKQSRSHDFAYYKNIVKAILYLICGLFIMVAPAETLKWFMLALGAIMAIDGICTIVYSFIQANEKYSEKYAHLREKVVHHHSDDSSI